MPPAERIRVRKPAVEGSSCLWPTKADKPCQRAGVISAITRGTDGAVWRWKFCRTHAEEASEGGWLAVYT